MSQNEPTGIQPDRRRTKIVATLGPASSDAAMIRVLAEAGANVFRLNFSHGSHEDHAARHDAIRDVEAQIGRPIAILADLQGPKLRVGPFANGRIMLQPGQSFRLDLDHALGDEKRVRLPHPEIIEAATVGSHLLLDDGKLRLRVTGRGPTHLDTEVEIGGALSDRKGVNVPEVVLPIPALTEKDRADLDFALSLGVDYVALSFVQRAEDVIEAREIVGDRAWLMVKLEKPQAMAELDAILAHTDAVMVARGDLGVELPPEEVPVAQKRIINAARSLGKPVVVATQMLESMITSPTPTRAEVSDVANAVYDGADAVMLSAESAAGQYAREAVQTMARVLARVERDDDWRAHLHAVHPARPAGTPDAIAGAAWHLARTLPAAAIAVYTQSGKGVLRIARERPLCPVLALTPHDELARRLVLVWGVHAQSVGQEAPVSGIEDVVEQASELARADGIAKPGEQIVITAGLPFAHAGTTNTLRVAPV
ncbi:pyruvate kinase [Tanticharoenia sakaeratensis]|uniref:Pyruvate kinase n=1 Tax=Tanticharoenia sakaeratensis NBRC 103193 TaxID=1231623 RepID=A0A0D6MJ10_9PROT|nr:pyruvate kinase [Tanticharoenia sakaeratensis]GAN53476.1 pyruvate kinase [Tanticharoenia sakaeratensis NBRC 103193]GBQ17763.1 pyruvate kinase [Tanticharoenia sakaeratensis NBRC 103193]